MKSLIIIALACMAFISCKKDYTCTCTLPDGSDKKAFNIKDTKKKAEKQCKDASKFYLEEVFIAEYDCKLN